MAERNGVDIAAVLELVATLAADMREVRRTLESVDARVSLLQRDVSEIRRENASIREELRLFTGTVQGHGILLTEHDERLGRLERSARPA